MTWAKSACKGQTERGLLKSRNQMNLMSSLYRPNITSKIPSDSNDIMLDCRWPNEEGFEIGQMLLQISA
jgi:hypothetical protein